jgi:hypothetical protein
MEILGVLLGITMCAVASAMSFLAWYLKKEYRFLRDLNHAVELNYERISALEHRKAFQPIAADATPVTQPAPKLRYRTWNEDAVMPEKSN